MKILFIHQNFPGQFKHLARVLAADANNEVVFLTQRPNAPLPGVRTVVYKCARQPADAVHRYLRDTEAGIRNGQAVARAALQLKKAGFIPDVMVGHNGWGEIWYLKDVFPQAPLLGYFEFFYRASGADVGFDPALPTTLDTGPRIKTKNLGNLLGLEAVDMGLCPTQWQKSVYPARYHGMLEVVHDGIDTDIVRPDPQAQLQLPGGGIRLSAEDEVVTYVARNLEPYRGFPSFMRSLPAILNQRPRAHVLVVGGDGTSYGTPLLDGRTYKQQLLEELGGTLELSRVHFLGKVPYPFFLRVLQVSSVHVYLTYPFVLSWSMLEAMAAGCLVVGSRTAPVEEVVEHGQNGLLVDFFSPQEIAEQVIAALANPQRYRSLREAARGTVVQRYDLATVCLPAQLARLNSLLGK